MDTDHGRSDITRQRALAATFVALLLVVTACGVDEAAEVDAPGAPEELLPEPAPEPEPDPEPDVDFTDFSAIIPNASTSCGSATLLAQLDNTLGQFPDLGDPRYSFDGDVSAFYEWLQLAPPDEV